MFKKSYGIDQLKELERLYILYEKYFYHQLLDLSTSEDKNRGQQYQGTADLDRRRDAPQNRERSKWHCKKGCDTCCTCNVTMTSLECEYILTQMSLDERYKLISLIYQNRSAIRYHPEVTTNGFAQICMDGGDIPIEDNDPSWGKCPLLGEDHLCPIYEKRPFGCRSLVSEVDCFKSGYAEISPLTLTVNNIFMQYIEHLDSGGITGNFTDMMLAAGTWDSVIHDDEKIHIIYNRKARLLMIPPEHRNAVEPLLKSIFDGKQ
ncbi:conserved hypothetical protein [Desulfamplus magnetovallimortis]|uniref:YkgJ family cysteine cluster protein n=1 Tax=Desulfamplus magnetovallimortis TaxID=1246637 RepID=A0A1W1H8U2_9BACT|nr:hypothetical protein [Desulfamplus magnetovallimortis]SLM28856.1 conserved hypothetical protein [Desulfamplus magnetovallimortis]